MKSRKTKSAKAAPALVSAEDVQLVEIEKPIYGGAFLARVEGKAVFVPMVLPGEQARIRITQSKSGYSTAEPIQILAPSPDRVPALCPHFGSCGGCNYQHAPYETQLAFKQAILRETLERAGVVWTGEIALLAGEPWAYRNRIRLAMDAEGRLGYRARRSAEIVPLNECPIAAPLLMAAADAVAEALARVPKNLRPHEVQLFCDAEETQLLATLFTAEGTELKLEPLARALAERIPQLKGAELAAGGRPGRPQQTLAAWGAAGIEYKAAGFNYRVDRGAFFQVNRWLIDALVETVTSGHRGHLAWDLFAGVGLFARRLAEGFERVVAVESAGASAGALKANLAGTGGVAGSEDTLAFLRQAHTQNRAARPDLIVVDPPRTGLGADVTTLLAEIAAPALVYVSCDPATLARDLKALLAGGYRIDTVTLADLFPQTFHLETVVQLRRN
jgi:23S rRNA (uracil1939-C5)-methyltransferase